VVNEDLVHAVEEKIHHFFIFPSFSTNFKVTFHKIVSEKLRFQKLSSSWVPKMLMDEHKMKRQASRAGLAGVL
jgi:hypothetical protein